MANTFSKATINSPGPSTITIGILDKRPQHNEIEKPDFNIINPYYRESYYNTIPEKDIKKRLANLELKISINTPKIDKAQQKLLIRDNLINKYYLIANK